MATGRRRAKKKRRKQIWNGIWEGGRSPGETAVWWEFDECPLPADRDCDHVSTYLKWALGRIGSLSGQLEIFAFGDACKLPNRVLEGFLRQRQRLRLTHTIKCFNFRLEFLESSSWSGGYPEKSPTNFKKYIFCDKSNDDADHADHITFPPNFSILSSFSTIDLSRVKLPVWWDIESCPVPKDCEVAYVPSNIQCSLLQEGLHGRFTLFVDTTRIWKSHINRRYNKKYIDIVGVKYSREEMIKAMAEWGDNSPPQSTCVLISCDVAYERILRNLGCKHNVVVGGGWPTLLRLTSSPYGLPISYLWEWGSLAHGDLAIRRPTYLQCKARSLIDRGNWKL